uniref:Uncharacterized protein n=1 Tax=Opuntia streptacantha TaxID=393608 RepID=A0A7C9DKX8_OPUST
MFRNVSFLLLPRNGVFPYNISYASTPRAHQSTPYSWPSPFTTSGDTYSSVPTKEFDLFPPAKLNLRRLTAGDTFADFVLFWAISRPDPYERIRIKFFLLTGLFATVVICGWTCGCRGGGLNSLRKSGSDLVRALFLRWVSFWQRSKSVRVT